MVSLAEAMSPMLRADFRDVDQKLVRQRARDFYPAFEQPEFTVEEFVEEVAKTATEDRAKQDAYWASRR